MSTDDDSKVRYAVVGLGNIAQVAVLPAFEHAGENSKLVALVSSDLEKLSVLSERYGVSVTGSYDDFERVIEEARVQAVYLAVPNAMHRSFAERAARAGAHVLCEKPMATTEDDCAAMIRVAAEQGVKLMIAYRLHFEAANLEAVERLRSGAIGNPRVFSSLFTQQVREGDIRTRAGLGGGALFDLGIYCLNAARYIFHDEPVEASAVQFFGSDERSNNVDETTAATLRFPGNRVAQFTASQGAADVAEFRVIGTAGELRLSHAYSYTEDIELTATVDGKATTRKFSTGDQFAPELVYFSQCILEGLEPEPGGAQGLADVRIIQAIIHSAQTGKSVALTPVPMPSRPNQGLIFNKPPVGKINTVNAPSPSK